jgi:PAS domain S-box-containing protein
VTLVVLQTALLLIAATAAVWLLAREITRLRERGERYSRVVETIEEGHWEWNLVSGEPFLSERVKEILGFAPDAQFPNPAELFLRQAVHPDDRKRVADAYKAVLSGASPFYEMEYRVLPRPGEVSWVRSRARVFFDERGVPALLSGSLNDITQHKLAGEALREEEARFRRLTKLSSDWYWRQDENLRFTHIWSEVENHGYMEPRGEGRLVTATPSTQQTSPLEADSSIGKTRWELAGIIKLLNGTWAEHKAVLEARQPFRDFEYCRIGPDGVVRYISISGVPVFDEEGRFKGYEGVGLNFTERKRIEQDLRERQESLDVAQKAARAVAFEWRIGTGEGQNRWSPDLELMYGLAPGSYDGTFDSWSKLVFAEDWPAVNAAIERAAETGDLDAEYRVVHPDSSAHRLHAKGRFILDAERRPSRIVGFMLDVTERHQAEEERRQLERQLRQAQRLEAMGTLAGGIAHDFNNILGAVLGYGERALRGAPKESRLRRDLDNIMIAGERGRALVDRILEFSRSGVSERIAVHVDQVVGEALDLLAAKLPPGVRIERQLRSGRAAVLGDPTQVHQLLMNLATNAIQAMTSGGTLRVLLQAVRLDAARVATIGAPDAGDYVVLEVGDSGVGIAPETLRRIFDPFFTTKEVGAGTGLGLSLVHGIVTELGGAIDVASTVGGGSTFTVYLPRAGDAEDDCKREEPDAPRGNRQQVLIVDDEEPLVRLATETLADLGYAPFGFTSSSAALEAFRAEPERFDAVITDEAMPGMTGSALIRELRGIRREIPILLMSGFIGGTVSSRAREAGADEVLKKPVSERELATSLARVLRH